MTTSLQKMADAWGWSRPAVQRFIARLEDETLVDTRKGKAGTEISLTKPSSYIRQVADDLHKSDTPPDTPQDDLFSTPDVIAGRKFVYTKKTALPHDFELPKPWGVWAMESHSMTRPEVIDQAIRFKSYWIDKAETVRGKKKNWPLVWQNWIASPYRKAPEQAAAETDGFMAEMRRKHGA